MSRLEYFWIYFDCTQVPFTNGPIRATVCKIQGSKTID